MPYTPPQQSPVSSAPETPSISRSHSQNQAQQISTSPPRPALLRSTTYLQRHRRTPSLPTHATFEDPPASTLDSQRLDGVSSHESVERRGVNANGSLRQSPPPVNGSLIPTGAVTTPPDSSQNSSDDEDEPLSRRGRDTDKFEELEAVVRTIEQRREGSPERVAEEVRQLELALECLHTGGAQPADDDQVSPTDMRAPQSLTHEARKISHSRSSTEPSVTVDAGKSESPFQVSDDSDEERRPRKPTMVRKKSGELVKPALRPSSVRRRPSSMPGTPTYSKAVHFDSHLEHIRHFLQVDRPLAVSAGSSPVETYDSDMEFPFGSDDIHPIHSPPFEWEIKLPNFPRETPERMAMPVRVERVFLSGDNKNLVGTVAVANIAFHKLVVVRFTLDYWKTTSEVVAEYNNDVRRKQTADGYDRFNFSIKLADLANLENKTMFFCVRYNVNGQEFWDNNNSMNFQVDFTKKAKPQHGKQGLGARPLNALPRSRPSSSPGNRPKSAPTSFDDFADGFDSSYDMRSFRQPVTKLMGESPPTTLRLKAAKKDTDTSDDPARRNSGPQAFGNRYNFSASLSAALQAANDTLQGRSGLQMGQAKAKGSNSYFSGPDPSSKHSFHQQTLKGDATPDKRSESQYIGAASFPGSPLPHLSPSDKPSVESPSYQELLNKYCFFGSAKSSPQLSKPSIPHMDGASDESSVSEYNLGSAEGTRATSSPNDDGSPVISDDRSASPAGTGSPRRSRSTSPAPMTGSALGSTMSSPGSYGYPYQPMRGGIFDGRPTAIRG